MTAGVARLILGVMKFMLMPKEPTWWVWLATVALLILGLAGFTGAFGAAIALSAGQAAYFLARYRSWTPYPVQIRIGYTALLLAAALPGMRGLYWLPTLGTTALILFGYCLMARVLSLLPWNRDLSLSRRLLRDTFFTAPVAHDPRHGLPAESPSGYSCTLEGRIASARSGTPGC